MDFGQLLARSWNIIWENKFLILLGVLVALGSSSFGTTGGGSDFRYSPEDGDFSFERPPDLWEGFGLPVLAVAAIVVLVVIAVAIGFAFWVVGTIAHGGLIGGVSTIDAGGVSSIGQAWNAGWQKGWRLLSIGILPAIPAFILAFVLLLSGSLIAVMQGLANGEIGLAPMAGFGMLAVGLTCVLVPITLALALLRTFADRACMLEDLGVFASYRRGWEVLIENIGPAPILFLIQIAIKVALMIVLFLPSIVMIICCLLWPVLLLIKGTIAAYFSTLWTLAWREWTGPGRVDEIAPQMASAV